MMTPTSMIIAMLAAGSVFVVVFGILSQSRQIAESFERRLREISGDAAGPAWERAGLLSATGRELPKRAGLEALARRITGESYMANLKAWLIQANIPLRPYEFLFLRAMLALGGAAVGAALLPALWMRLVLIGVTWQIPVLFAGFRRQRRLARFSVQLSNALDMIISSLRGGQGFMQALEYVEPDLPQPIGTEFRRLLHECSLGIPMETALASMLRRVPTHELEITVAGWMIQREAGGNLSEVLEKISQTIRERIRLRGEVKALTAQGRISGMVAAGMPVLMVLALLQMSPDYIMPLFTTPLGQKLIVAGAGMQVVGSLIIWRMVSIDI